MDSRTRATGDTVVVVPMHNEGTVGAAVVSELLRTFDHVVCVDDGSGDDSARVARDAGAVVLRHSVNLGQGAALQTGFDYALRHTTAERVVTFDSDGQHDVGDAHAMVQVAKDTGVDVVLGSRVRHGDHGAPLLRRMILLAALHYSRWSSGLDLTDTHNGLRVLSRAALETIRITQPGMAHASELEAAISRHRLSWVEHPVTITYTDYSRAKGQSNVNAFNVLFDLAVAKLQTAP
ncbi:MAG: glycosyltransferase family 2 protein [Nocardioides sp.]|nr:glycosyltransferase family 2 protein [Nocardioides sp.]